MAPPQSCQRSCVHRTLPTLTGLGDAAGVAAAFAAAGHDIELKASEIVAILRGQSDASVKLPHPALIIDGTFNSIREQQREFGGRYG